MHKLNKIGVFSGRTVAVAVHKKMAETDALPCVWGKAFCFRHYNLASGYVKARISTPFRVFSLR